MIFLLLFTKHFFFDFLDTNETNTELFLLSLLHFGINTFARAMGKRAQFNFMFTDSTAKHFYGSVASMGFIIVHTTHGCFCFFFFISFFLRLAVPFCCRLFYPAKNYVYFIFLACRSQFTLSCSIRLFRSRDVWPYSHFSHFVRQPIFALCFALDARWTRCALRKSACESVKDASATVCIQFHDRT